MCAENEVPLQTGKSSEFLPITYEILQKKNVAIKQHKRRTTHTSKMFECSKKKSERIKNLVSIHPVTGGKKSQNTFDHVGRMDAGTETLHVI